MYGRLMCLTSSLMMIQLVESAPKAIQPNPEAVLSIGKKFTTTLPNIAAPNLKKFQFESLPNFKYCGVCVDGPCLKICRCVGKHCDQKPKSVPANPTTGTKRLKCVTAEDKSSSECTTPTRKRRM